MDEIKFALKKLYPWASDVNYVSKKGKMDVTIEYKNKNQCRILEVDEVFLTFLTMAMIHAFTSFPALCFIPNPFWANILFVVISVFIGIGACNIDDNLSTGEVIGILGINLILMVTVVLITWQIQMYEPNGLMRTIPKIFDFLFKFKF